MHVKPFGGPAGTRPAVVFLIAAPAFLFGYGVVRLIDGLDGTHGPGPAWTIGHILFLTGMVLFGVLVVGLRGTVPATTAARRLVVDIATVLTLVGLLAFVRVILIDIVVGLQAADRAEMNRLSENANDFPGILPAAVYSLGPALFEVGIMMVLIQLATLRPRRLKSWSPALFLVGFALISVNLDLLPVGAVAIGLAVSPTAWRPAEPVQGAAAR